MRAVVARLEGERHVLEPASAGEPWGGEVTDEDGTVHRAWAIGDADVHEAVASELAPSAKPTGSAIETRGRVTTYPASLSDASPVRRE